MGNMIGKVTVFCKISGCNPESADSLNRFLHPKARPLVREAVKSILSKEELDSENNLAVIGKILSLNEQNSVIQQDESIVCSRSEALQLHDSELDVVRNCTAGEMWSFGAVSGPPSAARPNGEPYAVSHGTMIMVQTASLDIMLLATQGRMTAFRLWRLCMHFGQSEGMIDHTLPGVDYGAVAAWMEKDLKALPRYMGSPERLQEAYDLEKLGDVEIIKQRLVHEGMYWIWMAPNLFPLERPPDEADTNRTPCHLDSQSVSVESSLIELLPVELGHKIASFLPLPTLLNFLFVSRSIRSKLIGFSEDRDALARAWILESAPWYIYPRSPAGEHPSMDWAYLRRCLESGNMRNRKRIWHTALEIERLADIEEV